MKKWKQVADPGLKISQDIYLNILLFADDILLIQGNEDALQRSIFKFQQICEEYNMQISLSKTKVMAFRGIEPVRTKIVLKGQILEQVSHFSYLGNDIGYDKDFDIDMKLHRFQAMCGTINRTLRHTASKETKIKFYKVMATPVILYGSELWTKTRKQESRIQATEMRFLRQVKGCTRQDHIRNTDIRTELNIYSICDRINDYKQKWKEHLERMSDTRIPKRIWSYKPKGRRSAGRPRRRWQDD